ncbi:MAG TPA: autotransporter domain-containing protein [Azospirillum sp.]|nr:autotransporter domain-containing protein [Azospirillum sp.]
MGLFDKALSATAAVALCCALPATAADFSSTIFFGDSLTDSGTFSSVVPAGGKFTTNPGPVWAENLAAAYGTTARPAVSGGTDYAVGGARVSQLPGVPNAAPTATATPVRTQISTHLAANGGRADPNALYAVWAGANDIFSALNTPATAQAAVTQAASDLVAEVARLRAAGARYIIVPLVPDIGATPFGARLGAAGAASVTQLVSGYNQLVRFGLAAAGVQVIPVDTVSLLADAMANPAAYGFTNTTGVACTTTSSLLCTPNTLVSPNAAQTYLFADGVHPTTAGHRVIADYVLNVLTAPANVALLAESPLHTRERLVQTIRAQAAAGLWGRKPGEAGVWVSGGVGRLEFERRADLSGAKGTPLDATIGVDKRFGENLLAGAAASFGRTKGDFASGGDYTQREYVISAYGVYRAGGFFVNGVGGFGFGRYDVDRRVSINGIERAVKGSTEGINASLAAETGYEFTTAGLKHGPIAGLHYQHVTVQGFSEESALFGFSYGEQTRNSLVGSIGYQVSYDFGTVLPYARAALSHEFNRSERSINTASLSANTLAMSYDMPVAKPASTFVNVAAGAAVRLAPSVTGTLGLTARLGENHVRDYGGMVGLSMGF